jgi:7-cyano-7-deazaguanine tRNA-ribosyltransferase
MRLVKQCIREGSLWDLLESRCRSHPRMLDGLRRLESVGRWLEGLDGSSKSTFFYLSPQSARRPEVIRTARQIERISLQGEVLITDDSGDDGAGFDHVLRYKPPFGPYPAELSETYPFNAEVPKTPDSAALEQAAMNTKRLMEANPEARFCIRLRAGCTEKESGDI